MLVSLLNNIKGYLDIEVEGFFLERFLNICIRKQILIWDIKKLSEGKLRAKISVKGFKLLRPVARKTRSRVRIVAKHGAQFVVHRHRKRRAFWVGALLFLAVMAYFCSCVWVIEIPETKLVEPGLIRQALKDCGIRQGRLKYNIDPKEIQHQMLLEIPEISWLWIDIKGTKAIVSLKEVIKGVDIVPTDSPCNIVAGEDGVITKMIVRAGVPVVKTGDVVHKGMLLVSGAGDSNTDGQRFFHSDAEIYANTSYATRASYPLFKTQYTPTQRTKSRFTLLVNQFPIKLFRADAPPFSDYELTTVKGELGLFDFTLPIFWKIDTFLETEKTILQLTEEEAVVHAREDLLDEQLNALPNGAQFVNQRFSYTVAENGQIDAESVVVCSEQIGVKQKIEVYHTDTP